MPTLWIAGVLVLLAVSGCVTRPGKPRLATGYIGYVVCSYASVFGLDPARVNEEDIADNPVFSGCATYDLRMAGVDMCRLVADTIGAR
ncbi:MAG: hypothetical protein DME04_13000 [Candidatus Rokuibacteriota bacterium]|nr:MAG: hypothetical protein DME04_13000 [Candidatus Rokubacteria bacterium]